MMDSISNSMTDDDMSLPIDFNVTTQLPRVMEATASTSMNEGMAQGKFSEVHTLKDHEMHISELKKENFELKLRIYFLEEKLQHSQRDVDDDDAFKINIELKVEIEKLKNELNEKRRLLVKASTAVESLDRNHQEQINKLREQHNRDLDVVKEGYEMKLREKEEVIRKNANQSEHMKNKLIEAERINRQIKEEKFKDGPSPVDAMEMQAKLQESLREKDRIIDELKSAVDIRETRIKLLSKADNAETTEQVKGLRQKIEEREHQVQDLNDKLKKSEASIKELRGSLYENDRKFQLAAQEGSLTAQKLNEKLRLKQTELDEMQEKFRNLQENLEKAQDIIDEVSLKDVEAFEEKSKALKAKDALIAELQGNLKQKEMENDHLTRSMARKDMELQKITESKSRQEDAARQIFEKEKELTALSEELKNAKNKLREASDQHDEQLHKLNQEHENQVKMKDQIIQRVTETLEDKESIIQDLIVTQENISLSSSRDDITDTKEELIEKLRNRLKERDVAVEANIEEKFEALQKKEEEMQELRKCLRERERLIENINAVVLGHEDEVKNLKSKVEEKTALIRDLRASQTIQEHQFQEANEIALKKSRENEGLIEKLKRNLANREQQIENLNNVLRRNATTEVKDGQEAELVKELSATLKEKEKLVADLLEERSTMVANYETNIQKMMHTLSEKDGAIKDLREKAEQVNSEKDGAVARLQQQVNDLSLDVQNVENSKLWTTQEHEILVGKLKQSLVEKDRTIEKLINSGKEKDKVFVKLQECTSNRVTSPVRLELTNLKNKVQELEKLLQEKQDVISKLERVIEEKDAQNSEHRQDNMEYMAELEHELEQKNYLLQEAAETIEAFQAKLNSAQEQNVQEKQLEKIRALEGEISSLQEEKKSWSLHRENIVEKSPDQVGRLEELLQQQIQETSRLGEILKKEREAYEEVIKQTNYPPSSNFGGELKLISELRRSLEEGIVQNNKLRARLQERLARSSGPDESDGSRSADEVRRLHAKLEESERWNMSLQSRLDALQPRARGVGGSSTNLSVSGSASSSPQLGSSETNGDSQQVEEMKSRLNESQKLNIKLQEQLEKAAKARSEEKSALNQLNEQRKQEIVLLRQELKKMNSAHEQLRNAAKKADSEIASYKKEHDVEFSTLKKALEDSQKINRSLAERLREAREHNESQTSLLDRTTSPSGVDVAQLQNELAEKNRTIELLNKKLQRSKANEHTQTSLSSPEDSGRSAEGGSPKSAQIRRLQKELEEKQQLIEVLTEELNEMGNEEPVGTVGDGRTNFSGSPRTSKVSRLERELAESQKIVKTLREKLEIRKEDKQDQTSFDKVDRLTDSDVVDGSRLGEQRQLQKELQDVYKKNEELRKAVSENSTLVDLNRQLKQELTVAEQRGSALETELQNLTQKVKGTNSDDESRLASLQRQEELATKFRKEAINARSMNEKLSAEVRSLHASLESAGKENESLREALSASKHSDSSTLTSPGSRNLFNSQYSPDGRRALTREVQALREKLHLSERLNTALKYELEANKKLGSKSSASDEPLMGHLEELRQLRSRLEESIKTYDDLCAKLEEKLGEGDGTECSLKESVALVKENENLRLKVGKFNEEMKVLQQQVEEHRLARKREQEQLALLNSQLIESNKTNESLRNELAICDSVIKLNQKSNREGSESNTGSSNNDAIMLLLAEIRSLREQLEASIQSNNSLRQMLQKQLSASPPRQTLAVRSPQHGVAQPQPDRAKVAVNATAGKDRSLSLESQNLQELRQYINSSFQYAETLLVKIMRITLDENDSNGKLDELKKDLESLRTLLFKSVKLLDHLWAEHLSSGPTTTDRLTRQNDELRKEITLLKKRVLSQSKILENTATRLETVAKFQQVSQRKTKDTSSRMRKEVERSLFARLSETRDTIGSSRKQLEDRLASRNGN